MKKSLRQTILTILCIAIVFIPTYIAATYFFVKTAALKGSRYSVDITAYNGETVVIDANDVNSVAKSVIKMTSALKSTSGVDLSSLPQKYYDIKVSDNGTVYDYRYYFSIDKTKRSLVTDRNNSFYYLEFKDAKAFLSRDCSYMFYENSSLPALSIFGGDDVLPKKAEWEYKAVNGSFVDSPSLQLSTGNNIYAMSGRSKLSFSTEPDKCSVRVFRNGTEILKADDLDSIPYSELDSASLSFIITAEWTSSNQYKGYAEYEFSTAIGKAPKFYIDKTTIEAGEFFIVTGTNISAPQKIEFSSVPALDFTPTFFSDGDYTYAFIPADKDLLPNNEGTINYTFTFKYGDSVSNMKVKVVERSLGLREQDYNYGNITVSRNEQTLARYYNILSDIGNKSENVRYFGSEFIDFLDLYNLEIPFLGYGHIRKPTNGDEAFRLDGVDYQVSAGLDVPAIAAGKVVYNGYDDLLGNFVVVDHGFGLKTWYCHLSNIIAPVGLTVGIGDTVGQTGHTGYINHDGVYLITTIMNVPVSPYSIQEEGIVFHTPNN